MQALKAPARSLLAWVKIFAVLLTASILARCLQRRSPLSGAAYLSNLLIDSGSVGLFAGLDIVGEGLESPSR